MNRILSFTFARFEGKVPTYDAAKDPEFIDKVAPPRPRPHPADPP